MQTTKHKDGSVSFRIWPEDQPQLFALVRAGRISEAAKYGDDYNSALALELMRSIPTQKHYS